MKLIVIGVNGQLGRELGQKGNQRGHETIGLDLPAFNITDQAQVAHQLEQLKPHLIINASAYTAVDKAESDAKLAYAVNENGPRYLSKTCAALDIPMIHISTDYVFSGDKKSSYVETDVIAPTGVYGLSKAAGEEAVRKNLDSYVIIRTAWLYGLNGQNFVKTMLRLGKEKETIRVVADQHGCPTYAADLASAILDVAGQVKNGKSEKWGTYHYCGNGHTTWYGFANAIFELAKSKTRLKVNMVTPVSTEAYPTPARRPANSILDCSRIKKVFNVQARPWKESLSEMLTAFLAGSPAIND